MAAAGVGENTLPSPKDRHFPDAGTVGDLRMAKLADTASSTYAGRLEENRLL